MAETAEHVCVVVCFTGKRARPQHMCMMSTTLSSLTARDHAHTCSPRSAHFRVAHLETTQKVDQPRDDEPHICLAHGVDVATTREEATDGI